MIRLSQEITHWVTVLITMLLPFKFDRASITAKQLDLHRFYLLNLSIIPIKQMRFIGIYFPWAEKSF
ncbi:hypothetical protein CRN61_10395 [Vibrio vulnificus]|nr:hypothetical protein CRN54_06335 [Vibrio vulnificus]POC79484.1 hypothetical protein CRN61_10395 [Vibrio vulnificus]